MHSHVASTEPCENVLPPKSGNVDTLQCVPTFHSISLNAPFWKPFSRTFSDARPSCIRQAASNPSARVVSRTSSPLSRAPSCYTELDHTHAQTIRVFSRAVKQCLQIAPQQSILRSILGAFCPKTLFHLLTDPLSFLKPKLTV